MDIGAAAWLVILLALVLANLPFFNERFLALVPFAFSSADGAGRPPAKPFLVRLLELTVLYFVVGGIGRALEGRIGTVFPQTWEFYAITACMFLVLAFPGFVVRYLRKRH
ncbi:DUF2818 family protein [Pseudoduganella umbonata]|uniref:DUF2818 family protein n=1 Tax=Pseudoduganella umbonata TaxID=864828 RepID=A0A4P8HRE9_9BURK|nr:DUF2818 family protein [Pseudoduganella umbonata]MBB3224749.1 hypothetical protein [Pseudoduganella umbonata]QCP11060.1 DUF2818 family protein [Pseudoduganella umbonata]